MIQQINIAQRAFEGNSCSRPIRANAGDELGATNLQRRQICDAAGLGSRSVTSASMAWRMCVLPMPLRRESMNRIQYCGT